VYGIYFARCMNIFNSLLPQLVDYDVHTTRKINSIHAIFYHILSLYIRPRWVDRTETHGFLYSKTDLSQESLYG